MSTHDVYCLCDECMAAKADKDKANSSVKVGDVVIFVDEGRYSKWFWGKVAKVVAINAGFCQVRWLQKVQYHDLYPTVSNFNVDRFEVLR